MSAESPSTDVVVISYSVDRTEMSRRGKLGSAATHSRNDCRALTEPARRAFNLRFATDDERRAYFSELGRKSAEARRRRAEAGVA